jgi:hypothetical protein
MAWGWKDDANAKNGFNTPMTSAHMEHPKYINSSSKPPTCNQLTNIEIKSCNFTKKKPSTKKSKTNNK